MEIPRLPSPADIYRLSGPQLLSALALKEGRFIERKPPGFQPRALGDYFSMWANTGPNGGLIVVGMADDGTCLGLESQGAGRINDLDAAGRIYCPAARYESKQVPFIGPDGKADVLLLILVPFQPDKVVETVKGEAFIRRGESKYKLTAEEIRELQSDRGQLPFERERTQVPYPDGFEKDLVQQFCASVREDNEWDATHENEDILVLKRLGNRDDSGFHPNNACALLLASDPRLDFPGSFIRFLRFDGESERTGERFNAVKDISVEGPVPKQIERIEQVLESQLRQFSRLGGDGKFYTAPEYPKFAWYEAVVNACVHRSYSLRAMNIFVKMFDDRLEIESPGGFPGLVNPETIYEIHNPRNPYLMEGMKHLRFVKCAHEGARRMREEMTGMHLPPPEFRQGEASGGYGTVRVTLRNNVRQRKVWIDSDVSAMIGETIYAGLNLDERRALNFVAEHGTITVTQLQRLTGRSWETASKVLKRLETKGLLEHKFKMVRDPKAHYVLRRRK